MQPRDGPRTPDNGEDLTTEARGGVSTEKRLAREPEGPAYPREGGLVQTVKRTLIEFKQDNGTDWAAALTYYAVLSIFPALIAMISLVGLVADPEDVTRNLTDVVEEFGPGSAADTLQRPIEDITARSGTAGILFVVGLVGALWTASAYVGAFMRASNRIYEVEEGRPIYKLRPLQMLVTLIQVLLLALVALALAVSGPVADTIGQALGIGDAAVTAWDIAKWPVMAAVVLLAITLLYYASPNAKVRGIRSVLPGALLAIAVWLVASAAFALYVGNFGSYNKTYGTLGGVVVFLVWLWLTNVAVVLGEEFNAERERSQEMEEGRPGAERELQIDLRDQPKPKRRARTG